MVDDFIFFKRYADTLHFFQGFGVVIFDQVRSDFRIRLKMLSDLIGKVFFASSFFSLNVDDDFISLHGVVIYFPDFDLPGSDAVDVIKYVFEIIEVNQCAFDLSDLQAVDV